MGKSGELEKISVWLEPETAAAFKAWARTRDGSASAALRRLIVDAMFLVPPPLSTGGRRVLSQFSKKLEQAGKSEEDLTELIEHTRAELVRTERATKRSLVPNGGRQVKILLTVEEREALARAAAARGTSPANWVRSLIIVRLTKRPQWSESELQALRDIGHRIDAVASSVNTIAIGMREAVRSGHYPKDSSRAVKDATEILQNELRRVIAVMTGNFDYWGLPTADRLEAAPGAIERDAAKAEAAEVRRREGQRKRRAARFNEDE